MPTTQSSHAPQAGNGARDLWSSSASSHAPEVGSDSYDAHISVGTDSNDSYSPEGRVLTGPAPTKAQAWQHVVAAKPVLSDVDADESGHGDFPWLTPGEAKPELRKAKGRTDKNGVYTKDIGEAYAREQGDALSFRGKNLARINAAYGKDVETKGADGERKKIGAVHTDYFDKERQKQARVGFVKKGEHKGRLTDANGQWLDTSAATGKGTVANGGAGKHIASLDRRGHLNAVDSWAEHSEKPMAVHDKLVDVGFVNHSSLTARQGKDGKLTSGRAAWAGELSADNGVATGMSDESGHHKTDSKMMYQGVKHMVDRGAADMMSAKYIGKHDGQRPLIVSPQEVLSHGKHSNSELSMRQDKAALGRGISKAVADRDLRLQKGQPRMHSPRPAGVVAQPAAAAQGDLFSGLF